jgi:predicted  nucleic acid-binding Zn-ribbon protein
MQELELLNNKLDLLLKKYAALQAENKSLKKTVSDQLKSIEKLNHKLASVEENMAAAQMGQSLGDNKDKDAMRKQLDTVIAEIDKILTTLND